MLSKIKTIWKYGILFADSYDEVEREASRSDAPTIYRGPLETMSDAVAQTIVEIHPDYEEYFEAAMMPLYKTYGKNKTGTEDAKLSLKTLRLKSEEKMNFIFIWKIL
jgi:hypothetical protein